MKIAITHPYSWPEVRRGAERIIVETAAALARRGHDVTLFTAGTTAARTVDPAGFEIVRFRRLHSDQRMHERWFATCLSAPLLRGQFAAVHSMMPRDAWAAIRTRRFTGHRVVYEELGNPSRSWWESIGEANLRGRVVEHVDVYGCMSQYALHVLRRDHDRRGVLIPGGVDLLQFQPSEQRETRPTVLLSGALEEPRKGASLLLDAIALLSSQTPDVELWLSGPGDVHSMVARAPAAARERTKVLGLGEPREQGDRYARAWVTALPSIGDSFGMALLESLACGTPIVALDDAAPPELVTPSTGALARPGDPVSLADALARALALSTDPNTVHHCRHAATPFGWDALTARLESIYHGELHDDVADTDERVSIVDKILADPPEVHQIDDHLGVWSTEPDCYRFMAVTCPPRAHTLETGIGLSTAVFAALGTQHTCVAPGADEVDRVRRYCATRAIDVDLVEFVTERSELALPHLADGPPLDLVLIDGSHGHPMPTIDWFYACSRLRRGGIVIVDDVALPAPALLVSFLEHDPRWQVSRRTAKWVAYLRDDEGSLSEDWWQQPFLHLPTGRMLARELATRGARRLLRGLRR